MNGDGAEARDVLLELRQYRDRIDDILERLEGKRMLSPEEREDLRRLLTALKRDLKDAAKRGTVKAGNKEPNPFERAYFAPAVQSASANLHVAVSSHPLRSDWYDALYGTRMDITYLLYQLEEQYPEI